MMDPEYAAALDKAVAFKSIRPPSTVTEARVIFDKFFVSAQNTFLEPHLPPDQLIPVDGGEISARCLVPVVDDDSETFPVLLYIHGGGFSLGGIEMDDYTLRIRCVQHKISIVNVAYRLAPEHPFPTPVNDCYAALKWTASNVSLLRGDLSKGFLIGGESAGANLSAVLAHMARDDPFFEGRRLTGQYLCEPNICHYAAYPESLKPMFRSVEGFPAMPTLSRQAIERYYRWYNAPPSDPRFSPLLYPSHQGLPRTYIQAMELDPLRDDAFVYTEVLREAGVETKMDLNRGVTHAFYSCFPALAAAARVRENAERGFEWLLRREQST
ncbi:Alpha/Beta hydrolase protein [Cubamyces menziesii]|nr:Alpha/Beta hydrolase protein [Cubamyces menziesii]